MPVKLQLGADGAKTDAVFLGRLVLLDGVSKDVALYEPATQIVHLIPLEKLTLHSDGEAVDGSLLQPIVMSINQEGGTCAAFSIFNCFRQLHLSAIEGNGNLASQLSSEMGRAALLTRVINKVYIENRGNTAVLEELATAYGYKIYVVPTDKPAQFAAAVAKYLKTGWPTLLRFETPSAMSETPYKIVSQRDGKVYDRRLWLPKGRFQFKKSSHLVLGLAVFEAGGEQWILVLDPNWQAPRLWKLSELDKMGSADMAAYVLWQEKPK